MSTSVRVTYDDYEAMIERGEFDPADSTRYELIDGEIVEMPPPNPPHQHAINLINRWSCLALPAEAVLVSVQGPIGLPDQDSIPLPDVVWLREREYSARRPLPEEVLLVIEVAESNLSFDRHEKARRYAAAGLADYWIVNLPGQCIEIHRDPGPDGYATRRLAYPGEAIPSLAFPGHPFPVSLAFPSVEPAPQAGRRGARP